MKRLGALEIYRAARSAGFERDDAVTWTAIALAESGGRPDAHASSGEDSRGLWQINLNAHKNTWGNLYDPVVNARAAYDVSQQGRTMRPWTVTHERNRGTSRDYRQYLDDAASAASTDGGATQPGAFAASSGFGAGMPGADVDALSFQGVEHSGPCCQPVSDAKLVDTFGAPRSGGRKHMGIDIFADEGTPIHAIAGGTVVQGFKGGPLGGVVARIQGDDGRYYYYAHLVKGSTDHLEVGERINAGQVIGEVGRTGNAATTPAHLHLQVRENGQWINPYDFIKELPDIENIAGAGPGTGFAADLFAMDRGAPPSMADADADGLLDEFEKLFGTDPLTADSDADQLSDAYETGVSHTDPLSADTDKDSVSDAMEIAKGTDPGMGVIPDAVRAAKFGGLATLDTDKDQLSDLYEAKLGTDYQSADTDKDTLTDAVEVARGSNPFLMDSDADGLSDPFELRAGTLEPVPGAPSPDGAGVDTGLPDAQADPVPSGLDPDLG